MTKIRFLVLLATCVIVFSFATLIFMYAKGIRFNFEESKVTPTGLLVVKSVPDGAEIYINGEFKNATNTNITLVPETYDIRIEKEGFFTWNKRLTIEKEEVTEVTAHLFKSAPSLSATTLAGAINPVPSRDFTKIAYIVPPTSNGTSLDNSGLWIIEMVNLPLGFSRDPKRITDGNLSDTAFEWSPDGREILLTTTRGAYLLPAGEFTTQNQRVNVISTKTEILAEWEKEKEKRLTAQLAKLPDKLEQVISKQTYNVLFSPDEDMFVYTASASATIEEKLITPVPGASSQKEERNIKKGSTYVYDIKEDRNFLIDSNVSDLQIEGGYNSQVNKRRLAWFPTSRHLILAEDGKIEIMDYDGTNRQSVYSGSFITPHAFPTLSLDRLIILTNLGASTPAVNLYSLSIK